MPQVDIKYSSDLQVDIKKLFQDVENIINELDSSAGVCKSRAYPAMDYLHTHFYLRVALLRKPHRGKIFMEECLKRIKHNIEQTLPSGCYYSIELVFSSEYYVTSYVDESQNDG